MRAKKSTSQYYKDNPEAAEKRRVWQRKENKKPKKRKYRAFLTKIRRKFGVDGNGDGKDYDHTTNTFMSAKRNRSKDKPKKRNK
jgi:hypothetical protein|tara:strand:+ start:175 stop:426 length:252 start_codon:yes stop_codon:yes gene_type:complete